MKTVRLFALVFLVLCLTLAFAACGGGTSEKGKNGTPPVYEGISLCGNANALRYGETTPRYLAAGATPDAAAPAVEGDYFDESFAGSETNPFGSDTVPLEEKAADTLKVTGGASDIYYAEKNQDLFVVIRLSNPDNYEIQSFTLNGVKYANYMFEKGSDMENLILKVNVGDTAGIVEYTLDAVKYIDGTEIKDVRLDGERTVKAGIRTDDRMAVALSKPTTTLRSVSFDVTVEDKYGLIENADGYLKALLYDGETILEKDLSLGESTVVFDGLTPNTAYQYAVAAYYDDLGGEGAALHTLAKKAVRTDAPLLFRDVSVTQTSITWDYLPGDDRADFAVSKLEFYLDGEKVGEPDVAAKSADGLLSGRAYTVVAHYDGLDGRDETISFTVKTAAKQAPTVSVTDLISSQTQIAGSLTVSDPDGICTVDEVALYKGDDKVRSTDERTRLVFADLQSGFPYRIAVTFSYDLNDGDGVHATTWSVGYPTLVECIAVDEMLLLNTNVVKHGEELNLRVYFTNPSQIEITAIYVNGQPVTVVGGDRIESAIIKFVPEEIGLIDFAVDRVDYTYQNYSVSQAIDSDVSVQYPIFGELEIKYTPITALPYDNSGDGVYLSFDNKYGYTVYAINESADFVRFADGQYYVPANAVSSIEYGYENYGHTTQTCSYSTPGVVSFGKSYQKVSTAEEFFAMTNGYYYLTDDIDLRNVTLTQPIAFTGVLNGNGHKIRGLSSVIDTSKTAYYDIINSEGASAGSFYDVSFTELYISVNATSDKRVTISPLGGARLVNCSVRGDIIGNQYVTVADLTGVRNSSSFNVNITLDGKTSTLKYTAETTLKKNAAVTVDGKGAIKCTLPNGKVYFFGTFDAKLTTFTLASAVFAIGDGALKNCTQLTEVTIPETVVRCGSNVLCECPLVRATLPVSIVNSLSSATIQSLKEVTITGKGSITNTFRNCSNLTSVTIGNGVSSLPSGLLAGCSSLQRLTIPFVGAEAGKTTSDTYQYPFGYIFGTDYTTGGTVTSQSYCGSSTNSLTEAYYYIPSSLRSVTITGGNILRGAFQNCSSLTSVTIGNGVTSIGNYAFNGCSGLTSVTIPDSVTNIGNQAFSGCSGLTSVTIGNGVTSIGGWAFYGCPGLTSILVKEGNVVFHSSGNCLIETAIKTLIKGCKTSAIPIDGSVTTIGNDAFRGCSGLTSVTIPDSVTDIGNQAFYGCSGLTSVTIPDSVTNIGNQAFYGCSGLTSVTIPDGVTNIGESAFRGCSGLTSVTIPDSVTNIGKWAFYGCFGLTSVTIGNGVTSIGNDAFYNCPGLTSILVKEGNVVFHSSGNCLIETASKTLIQGCKTSTIPIDGSVTSIGDAFDGCDGLTSITIPDSVTSIGEYAFWNCSGLTSINFTGTIAQWNAISKGSDWNSSTGNYTIHCTDGDLSK